MFTGIIEEEGKIIQALKENGTIMLTIESKMAPELKVDQSVSHNGVCLTVFETTENYHKVCAVHETIDKTTIAQWKKNECVNLERCMKLNDRLDGHIVQGHVDARAICIKRIDEESNWVYRFKIPKAFSQLIIEKGSVCINGISLTCFNVSDDEFDVAIIPYTFAHTNIRFVEVGNEVNIEFDVLGKYIARMNSKA